VEAGGEGEAAERSGEGDAATPVVAERRLRLAAWRGGVHFGLAGGGDHVRGSVWGRLAVVDARLADRDGGAWLVEAAHHERRPPRRLRGVDLGGHDPVPVRVGQVEVLPGLGGPVEVARVGLAGRDHHLPRRALDRVAVDVDVAELVVLPDRLQVLDADLEDAWFPQADVADRDLVGA
jgi:hypothetical protein